MSDIKQDLQLAEIAYRGSNYDEAYRKYSEVIEKDIENKEAWIGRGLSAGWKAKGNSAGLDECAVCLEKAAELGLNPSERSHIASQIVAIGREQVEATHQEVARILIEKDKKPMATGELYAVRRVGQLADRVAAFNDHWPQYDKAIEFTVSAIAFDDSLEIQKGVLVVIDLVLKESKGHFHKDHLNKLDRLRQNRIRAIKAKDPSFSAPAQPKESGSCFIATATLGDYNHPMVVELRSFRDEVLMSHASGRAIVRAYYSFSPPLANIIRVRPRLRSISLRLLIRPLVQFLRVFRSRRGS